MGTPLFGNIDHVIKVGDICGDSSYVGELALKSGWKYNTWIRDEAERNFVSQYLWAGAILNQFSSSKFNLQICQQFVDEFGFCF
jgi:hypothetical protein